MAEAADKPVGESADRPAEQPAEPRTPAEPEATPPVAPDSDDKEVQEAAELPFEQSAQVVNNFFGNVDAASAQFGGGGRGKARRSTGRIGAARIEEELSGYLEPQPFAETVEVLLRRGVVVLVGPEGIGKRAGALALLSAMSGADAEVTSLSPSSNLTQLVDSQGFRAGRAYLIQDWIVEQESRSVQRFDLDQLLRKVREARAYLVITTTGLGGEWGDCGELVVPWAAPEPLDLFAAANLDLPEDDLDAARELVAKLSRPRDVRALLARLSEGVAGAAAVIDEVAGRQVTDWFDQQRDFRELLSVAALVFLHGIPEMRFQSLLARLVELVGGHPAPVSAEQPFPQQRSLASGAVLDTVTRQPGTGLATVGQRRRRFVQTGFREQVLIQLVERYGFELWQPLHTWLDELALQTSLDIRFELATGIALYARNELADAEDILDRWADGISAERHTAALALSMMCLQGTVASEALRITLGWAERSGARRAITSAQALGGELGVRYQSEALSRLWDLVLRSQVVSAVASRSIVILFCAAVLDQPTARTVLRFLALAGQNLDVERRQRGKALEAITQVLEVNRPRSREPMISFVLRTDAATIPILGELWASVLRNRRFRGRALSALYRTLMALADGADAPVDLAGRLGQELVEALPAEERVLLERDLRAKAENPTPTPHLLALLRALGTVHDTPGASERQGERRS